MSLHYDELQELEAQYDVFQKLENIVHGTKVCEGTILQKLIYLEIKNSGYYTVVLDEHRIKLNTTNKDNRQEHKVDIFCISETPIPYIIAYNSKGKSFNNTESQESWLAEFMHYKKSIEIAYPGYAVHYIILKDEYNSNNSKKQDVLSSNEDLHVWNSQGRDMGNYEISKGSL